MSEPFDRRAFLRRGAVSAAGLTLLGGGASALLAACGSSSSKGTATTVAGAGSTPKYGTLDYQLSWIKNSEFSGTYIADQLGYFKAAGFSGINIIAGGPSVSQDAAVQAGKAFIGISVSDTAAAAINKGASIVAIGAQYQKNPFCVMSLASKPISTPTDMIGKKIGVQAVNEPVWDAFLKVNKIDPTKIHKVTVQFDPTPLVTGEVDGWFSFITNEPNLLKDAGHDTKTFLLNDFGYPSVSEIYIVKRESLTGTNRDKVKAALVADIKGWRKSVTDSSLGAKYTVDIYGKDLKLKESEQKLEVDAESALILTPDTKTNGIFTITQKQIDDTIATLNLGGIKITADKLFDMSVLTEVYQEHPELKADPTA